MNKPVQSPGLDTAVDPVCGMQVSSDSELKYRFEEIEYHFCSSGCEQKFIADPARYLDHEANHQDNGHDEGKSSCHHNHAPRTVAPAASKDAISTCPMHPEVRQVGPGSCP